jgi:hypothetical protein
VYSTTSHVSSVMSGRERLEEVLGPSRELDWGNFDVEGGLRREGTGSGFRGRSHVGSFSCAGLWM